MIFELPVVILPGVNREFKHKVTAWLVREFGTDVNLANLEWDEIWIAEMTRRGAGDTSHPDGAYNLTGPEGRSHRVRNRCSGAGRFFGRLVEWRRRP